MFVVAQSLSCSCPTLCVPMDCSITGSPVHHQLLEFAQIHVHWVSDAIQPSHPLPSRFPPAFNFPSIGLYQWVSSFHQVAKVLELQLYLASVLLVNIQGWFPLGCVYCSLWQFFFVNSLHFLFAFPFLIFFFLLWKISGELFLSLLICSS